MSSESESEDDLLEQAYGYKVHGRYPEGCTLNKKRSIRRKRWFYRMAKCTKGMNEVGKKLNSLISCMPSARMIGMVGKALGI